MEEIRKQKEFNQPLKVLVVENPSTARPVVPFVVMNTQYSVESRKADKMGISPFSGLVTIR